MCRRRAGHPIRALPENGFRTGIREAALRKLNRTARLYVSEPDADCLFCAVIERARLPAEDFEVGVLIANDGQSEYVMTENRLLLASGKSARAVHVTAP